MGSAGRAIPKLRTARRTRRSHNCYDPSTRLAKARPPPLGHQALRDGTDWRARLAEPHVDGMKHACERRAVTGSPQNRGAGGGLIGRDVCEMLSADGSTRWG